MAEKGKKPDIHTNARHVAEVLLEIFILLLLIVIIYFSYRLNLSTSGIGHSILQWVAGIFPTTEFISVFISLLFFMGIIYISFRLHYLEKFEKNKLRLAKSKHKTTKNPERMGNIKWQRVIDHVNSQNPNDWRLAILEGDILLGDMLEKMGYRGDGIGDMLKSVEKSDFNTIDNAWEAHKIRNAIAHEGADFILTQREAKRVVSLYESVFHEFRFI